MRGSGKLIRPLQGHLKSRNSPWTSDLGSMLTKITGKAHTVRIEGLDSAVLKVPCFRTAHRSEISLKHDGKLQHREIHAGMV